MEDRTVQQELSHQQARALFGAFVDEELEREQARSLEAHLHRCDGCRVTWQRYAGAIGQVRSLPRQPAPEHLASLIVRRLRRARRVSRQRVRLAFEHRVPVEVSLVLLIASLGALLIIMF